MPNKGILLEGGAVTGTEFGPHGWTKDPFAKCHRKSQKNQLIIYDVSRLHHADPLVVHSEQLCLTWCWNTY